MASDPAIHGEDRNPNADPKIIENIAKDFQDRKKEILSQGGVIHTDLNKFRDEELDRQKVAYLKERVREVAPQYFELRGEFGHLHDEFVTQTTTAIAMARLQAGGNFDDEYTGFAESVYKAPGSGSRATGMAKARSGLRSAFVGGTIDHAGFSVETYFDQEYIKEMLKAHGDLDSSGRVVVSRLNENTSATTKQGESLRDEAAAREQGIAVIQTEIPLLDERRAALAGSNDQAQLTTAGEVELTAMRAESITKQREMMTAFMGSLTGQDEWLTGGSQHGNSASSGPSGTSGPSSDSVAEERARFLAAEPPPNLQEIYLSQFNDHDMSGFLNAEHWWEEHKQHVAKLKYGYAQGTSFAPGGLALVGEMGPELVNLPRGSQVIPNPRLGGDVHVHLNVEGSVVAERDLAQRLRQELIRTSRRTVDLGFN